MIDHIGIVCYKKEVKKLLSLFKLLGYKKQYEGKVKDYEVNCIFLNDEFEKEIELIVPLSEKSVISNYLKKHNNRLHHIAYYVENTKKFKNKLQPEKVKGAKPNMYVTFLDPKKYGILIELVEYA